MSSETRNGSYIFTVSNETGERKAVSRFYIYSFSIHIFIIIAFASGIWMDRNRKIEFDTVQARLVKLGEERDKKLLPRITKQEPVKSSKTEQKANSLKPVEKKKNEKNKEEEKKVVKPPSLAELLSGTMQEIKKDARAEVTKEGATDGDDDGDVTDPALALKANMYTRKISALIRKNWNIPGIISGNQLKDLQTSAFFRITFSGEVYAIEIISSSGNKIFDSSVLEAIKKTGSLPLPEDRELKKLVLKEGFECPFTPG
ncbi:MAG TPA: energy transducer TonB [bacterium]|nr:energy transducer TonB [bacterium]